MQFQRDEPGGMHLKRYSFPVNSAAKGQLCFLEQKQEKEMILWVNVETG